MLIGRWAPSSNQNLQTFPFTGNMDNRGFGYDGISDKITTHGRSHLSLLRESYQKSCLKREKIIAVNLKVPFTAGLCLCWLLSFLLFLAPIFFFFFLVSVFSSCYCFCLFFLLSNIVGKCQIFFILFFFFVFHSC